MIDPATLVPEPPPGALCRDNGPWVICETVFIEDVTNAPDFELPCGQLYVTVLDVRRGIRWYSDGRLVKRFVFAHAEGSWSLSPTGEGPVVEFVAHDNWQNVDIDPEADEETWPTTSHGIFRVTGPSGAPIFHFAGLTLPSGEHRGVGNFPEFESAEVQARLCAALTG